ncbi:hypothetical protein AB7M49_008121 [Bradyrhizobium elkanii]|uniref:hypothetical protein n=1 Tax=Bradyrhizobium elkanii TaxID=29448 RepID=UPI0008415918|nr:hypothetical protein [Bradyrhizobium elkanii]ODM71407.1 hypothetical protein A6452_09585 [Bradyrhizobium elkanii]ODM76077.1 hypothetical protein A6X20_30110 [Bradyrhizobium elkanii]
MRDGDYVDQLANYQAMKRRIDAGNERALEQFSKSYELLRLSYRLLGKSAPDLSHDRADAAIE